MSPIPVIIAAALREAGIDADVDVRRDESKQTIQIRVLYTDLGRSRTVAYDMHESDLYVSRDPAEFLQLIAGNLVEYILKLMDGPAAPKIWSDALLEQFYEKTIADALMASGGPPPWPPPASTPAPMKPDGPRILDLESATAEPKAQPKRQIDV